MLTCSLTSVLLPQLAYYIKGNSGGPLLFFIIIIAYLPYIIS